MRDAALTITAFDWVPGFAQGHVRDLRVRWALEEAGFGYDVALVRQGRQAEPDNLARQPFGQVPALEIEGRAMFESGAIVWRIAETSATLLPERAEDRDRALSWVFAALNTVEPPVAMLAVLDLFAADREAARRLRPEVARMAAARLERLAAALEGSDHLVGGFGVADLMMASVLRDVPDDVMAAFPGLGAYVARCTARPAFAAALAGQMAPFAGNAALYEGAG